MKHTPIPDILRQIASISAMEPGRLSVIRQGPKGPYYNLQHHENGRNHTEYIPADQVPEVERNTAAYRLFTELVDQYAGEVIERTRRQRAQGLKKKPPIRHPSKPASKKKSAT